MNYRKGLQRNLFLNTIVRTFQKRVYLAVIIIFATSYAGVSVEQFGFISAVTALFSLMMEIPSGYLSDKMGHKKALLLGSVMVAIAPLGFVFLPNFYGVLFASVVYFGGVAFHSGTIQAFMHETLLELGREEEYGRISAHTQRWALFWNIFLVATVPLTYEIDPRLPFFIGFICQSFTLIAVILMTTPRKTRMIIHEKVHDGFIALLRSVNQRKEVALFFFMGVVTAMQNKIPEYKELYFQFLDIPLWVYGTVYSMMGIAGIVMTYYIASWEKTTPRKYYAVDYLIGCGMCLLTGVVSNPILGVCLFVILGGYFRVRKILAHTYLLRDCPTQNLKATYLSMYEFFSAGNGVWIPLVIGYFIGGFGIQKGYLVFGMIMTILLTVLYFYAIQLPKDSFAKASI